MNISEFEYSYYNDETWDRPVDGPVDVVTLVIDMVVFVVGVPGNLLVLWVTGSEIRRSVNAIWFLNLALADLLSCLALPIRITTILMHGNWVFGEMACHILNSLFYVNLFTSVLLLATISTDRFLLVFKSIWCQKYRVARRAWMASGLAWILALVLSIPYSIFGGFFEDLISKKAFCFFNFELFGPELAVAVIVTLFILSFLVPLVTMSICYTLVLLRSWRRPATRSTKTLKVVVAVVIRFFILWLPYQLSYILLIFYPTLSSPNRKLIESLYKIGVTLALVNCCINPVIYVAASQGLHIRVFKFLPGRLRQLLTED